MSLHAGKVCEVLGLLALANYTPILLKQLLGQRWAWPLDGGVTLWDGRPLLGSSKTWRGLAGSLVMASAGALALGMDWGMGAVVAAWSMGGDLFSSFCKRRLGLSSGGRATGLDQIPEALFPALAARGLLGLSALDVAVVVAVFLVAEMGLSVLFFKWHLRDRPY
jgi:CDP-2,3-bis-(O-geranylgeranyl)-sn-glycerol synthase